MVIGIINYIMMDLSFGFLSFREKVVIINMMNGYSDKLIFELLIL